jgi:hypothetical protein
VPGWSILWKLTFEADRDALSYLNDKFIGRYSVRGPQIAFYLPLSALRIAPYLEYSVRRAHFEFN